jgi:glycosyltransferase involved in cell wall biosynthesis
MRIALFVHAFFPDHFYGTEKYTLDLARGLCSLGHDVTVVTANSAGETNQPDAVIRYTFDRLPVVSIDKKHFPVKRVRETYYQPQLYDTLDRIVKDLQPELAHVTHLINHTAVLLDVLQDRGVPTVATLTDFFGFCYTNQLQAADGSPCGGPSPSRSNCLECAFKGMVEHSSSSRVVRWAGSPQFRGARSELILLASRLPLLHGSWVGQLVDDLQERPGLLRQKYRSYDALITPTRFLRDAYESNGFTEPMHNIWFGSDIDRSPKPVRTAGEGIRIGFIGQLAPHKGIDLLIDAFTRLPTPAAELFVFGREEPGSSFTQDLRARAMGYAIRFLGAFPQEDLKNVMDSLDLVVIPSRWNENSPLVLLNALATHTPVIVSDVPGLTEFLQPEQNGIAFALSDVDALEAALRRFINGELDARAMSLQTAYARTSASVAEDVQRIYHGLV